MVYIFETQTYMLIKLSLKKEIFDNWNLATLVLKNNDLLKSSNAILYS